MTRNEQFEIAVFAVIIGVGLPAMIALSALASG